MSDLTVTLALVISAKAGLHVSAITVRAALWIPAFAGMTEVVDG